jgi:beta-glucosidase
VKITNTGKKGGEEVVQLYVSGQNKNIQAPIKSLKGFQRISLKAGESKQLKFELTADDLSIVGSDGKLIQQKGILSISVGGGQPDVKVKSSSNVVKANTTIN